MRHVPILCLLLLVFCVAAEGKSNGRRKGQLKSQPRHNPRKTNRHGPVTKFLLYSNRAEEDCLIEFNQPATLETCRFNASLPLVMIVHGWSMDGALEHWIWKLVEALKSNPTWQINVIIADWLVSAYTHYPIAAQNTRDVGQEIAHFLEWLEESTEFSRDKAHLIGYSLGAHVSGFAGSYIQGPKKIGRITGLDPAGPLFEGMSPTDRLSPDDADFVDAIHTFTHQHMGLSVGIQQPVAHFDFYPNGGTFQPGCLITYLYDYIVEYGISGFAQTVKCAHERSVQLFIDSLRHNNKPSTGYWCKDMHTFNKGQCLNCKRNGCNTMGYHIRKARPAGSRRLFLKTRPQMPFRVYHYQFKIRFINEFQQKHLDPTFTISLTGSKDDVENLSIKLTEGISGNKTHTFLITLDIDIGELMMVRLKWEGFAVWENMWNTFQTIIPWSMGNHQSGLIVKSMRVKAGETQQIMTFCSQRVNDLHLYPLQEKTFVRC